MNKVLLLALAYICCLPLVSAQEWGEDLEPNSVIRMQKGWEISLDDYSNQSRAANLLWIELTFRSDLGNGTGNYHLEGWWGVWHELNDERKRFRLEFTESDALLGAMVPHRSINVCMESASQRHVDNRGGRRVGRCLNSALRFGINKTSSLPIYLDCDGTDLGSSVAIANNFICDKGGSFGKFRLPIFLDFEHLVHVAESNPSVTLDNIGELRNAAWTTRLDGSDPVLKFVFNLDTLRRYRDVERIYPCHSAEKLVAADRDLFGWPTPSASSERLFNFKSVSSHDDSVFPNERYDGCPMGNGGQE